MYKTASKKIDPAKMTLTLPQSQLDFMRSNQNVYRDVNSLYRLRRSVAGMYNQNMRSKFTQKQIEDGEEFRGGQWPLASNYDAIMEDGKDGFDVPVG